MAKGVIFDLDGTLIDTIAELSNASNYALRKLGYPTWSEAEYRTFVGNGVTRLLLRALPEDAKGEIDVARRYFNEYYEAHMLDTVPPYAGITELLAACRAAGIPTCVNTNKVEAYAVRMLEHVFPNSFLHIVGDQGENGRFPRKPRPDAALYLCREMDVEPQDCLFVGDSAVDFETARNGGLTSVLVDWGFVRRDLLEPLHADYLIDTPQHIWELLKPSAAL